MTVNCCRRASFF